jgi:TIR domain/AAA ATPase domain
MANCFVSYTGSDKAWAEWIGATLRGAGHTVSLQATDYLPGENFVLRMQEASLAADHTVVVLSARYLASGFASAEWAAAFATDPTGTKRALIPVAIEKIAPGGLWGPIIRIDLTGLPEDEARTRLLQAIDPPRAGGMPPFPAGGGGSAPPGGPPGPAGRPAPGPTAVEIWRLPVSAGSLVGRDDEIALLDRAWATPTTNVLTIVAWGGVGKTSLLNHWLARMATRGYQDAERVFAWSFDRQGLNGELDTSDQFLAAALAWLGAEAAPGSSVWERCRQLVRLVQQSRMLLILDGLEGLQEPPGPSTGTIKDPVLKMLVRELAALNRGLCVITSRLAVADLAPFAGQTCLELRLTSLQPGAGAALLQLEGVTGDAARLGELSALVGGHALTLRLLGGYIRTVFDGDASRWRRANRSPVAGRGSSPMARVMDAYDAWFEGRQESQIMGLVGLFNGPAAVPELAALRRRPVVPGLNDMLVGIDDETWAYAVGDLHDAGLLLETRGGGPLLDAHPLVRQHYRERHLREHPEAHREGHHRLYEHLSTTTARLPRTLTETLSLVAAVWHATQAGETAEALREVYWPRIAQDTHHLRDVVGAASSNYEVLSHVLAGNEREGGVLTDLELAHIRCDQALDLRMMGMNSEAVTPFNQSIELARSGGDDRVAANSARHLSQLLLALGRIDEARESGAQALRWTANLAPDDLERISATSSLGHIEHQRGDIAAAYRTFESGGLSARTLTDVGRPHAHRVTLYISIYRLCDLLLTMVEGAAELDGTGSAPDAAGLAAEVHALALVGHALNVASKSVTLAQALMSLADLRAGAAIPGPAGPSPSAFDSTVDDLRRVGQRPWLVHGLLTRLAFLRSAGLIDAAHQDLHEARSLSAEDGAVLQGLDCQLEAARLEAAAGARWQARLLAGSLAQRAGEIGYGRLERHARALLRLLD